MHIETIHLLAALDALHHAGRAAHLATWARSNDVEVRGVVRADLAAGDAWQRGLALSLAGWDRDAEALLAGLSDVSVAVRRRAAALAARFVPQAEALCAATLAADPETRARLIQQFLRRRRFDVAALLAPALLRRGATGEVRSLLRLAPQALVAEAEIILGPNRMPWRAIAASHSAQVLSFFESALTTAPNAQAIERLWQQFEGALPRLVKHAPAALLDLLRAHPPRTGKPWLPILGALLRHDPEATVDAIVALGPEQGWLVAGHRRRLQLRALTDVSVSRLALGLADHMGALATLLRALPPSRRAAPFAAVRAARTYTQWPLSLVTWLPHADRHAEVARMYAAPEVQADADRQRALWSWLPVDEARALCAPAGRPNQRDGTERAAAWQAWIQAVGRDRRGLEAVLEAARFLHNEQDPVRAAFWTALAALPLSLIEARHIPQLDALLVATLEARDTSYACRHPINTLAHRLLRTYGHQPEHTLFVWALRILERNLARDAEVSFPKMSDGLPRGSEHAIVAAVLAWLKADVSRATARGTLALARALDRRAWQVPSLQSLLGELALNKKEPNTRSAAVELWLAPPTTRDVRVRRLLDQDMSAATVHTVWRHLDLHRQDWLDPYLKGVPLRGAWGQPKVGWIPGVLNAPGRWLPRQQAALAQQYLRLANDASQHQFQRANTLRSLANLPITSVADLEPWVSHADVPLAEAALGALASLDVPGPALSVLLANLDGDRARVATYALPRLARVMPATQLGTELATLLARPKLKVTVHKEAVRLLGLHNPPGADALLENAWRQPGVHRDVRIALVHAARSRLPEAWAWGVLNDAATDADVELPRYLALTQPYEVPTTLHRQLLDVLLKLATHPSPLARQALASSLGREANGLGSADPATAAAAIADLWATEPPGSTVAETAGATLLSLASLPGALAALTRALDGLEPALAAEPLVPATPEDPDLPVSRQLEALIQRLVGLTLSQRPRFSSACNLMISHSILADRFRARAQLVLAQHRGEDDLTALAGLVTGATDPAAKVWLKHALRDAITDGRRPWPLDALLAFEASLGEAVLARLGLVTGAAARHGWSPVLIERLAVLRAHPMASAEARAIRIR